jgi:hypothetical protein
MSATQPTLFSAPAAPNAFAVFEIARSPREAHDAYAGLVALLRESFAGTRMPSGGHFLRSIRGLVSTS